MILEQALIVLLTALACLPAVMASLNALRLLLIPSPVIQDEIALCQLRRILSLSHDMEVSSGQVHFIYHGEEARISPVNGNLILQPGTQIFLTELDQCSFSVNDGLLYVSTVREGEVHEYALVPVS
ncbi:MAG: hypothetical protein IKE68_02855 [Solobacterium sp.]|nr:hypothetical protein [Solobacterium sp.]